MFKLNREQSVIIGSKRVEVPKLTIEKWKKLIDSIDTLPQIILNIMTARSTDDFAATAVVGVSMALDEVVRIVSVLTDLEPEYIEQHADLNELMEFVAKTVEKNDLQAAAKNFRAVLGGLWKMPPRDGPSR